MTELSVIARQACFVIMRCYDTSYHTSFPYVKDGIEVTRYIPRKTRWEKSISRIAKHTHAVRYRLEARREGFPNGDILRMLTVWECGAHGWAPTKQVRKPEEVCAGCYRKLNKTPRTVKLAE